MSDEPSQASRYNDIPASVFDAFAEAPREDRRVVEQPKKEPESLPPASLIERAMNEGDASALVETTKTKFDWKGTLLWSTVGALVSFALTAVISVLAQPNLLKGKPKPKKNKRQAEFEANNGAVDALYAKEKIDWGKLFAASGIVGAASFGASVLISVIAYQIQKGSNRSTKDRNSP